MKLSSLARSPVVAAALFFAGIALLQFGGTGWSQAVYKWSQTSGVNASVDPAINWAEGQAPSSVNDSARATMAGIAKWRDDLNGTVVTTNGPSAYSLTSNQVLTAFTVGHRACFSPNVTNTATVTVNVDSLGNKPLRSSPNTELGAGVLVQGTPYCATYFSSNGGEYILSSFYGNAFSVPLGSLLDYTATTAPNSNFVFPFGQCISQTTYAAYFAMVSTTYSNGCAAGTFGVPDLRGRVIAGMDTMPGSSAGGNITSAGASCDATAIGTKCGAQTITLGQSALPNIAPTITIDGISMTITDSVTGGNTQVGVVAANGTGTAYLSGSGGGTSHVLTAGFVSGTAHSSSINNNQVQTAVSKLMPTIVLNKILRIF